MNSTLGKRLSNLRDSSSEVADETIERGTPLWLKVNDGKTLDGFDSNKISETFSRAEAAQEYLKAIKPDGKLSDAQSIKQQSDMLAAMERDLRMRYRSRVRMFAHGAARIKSAGVGGGIFDTIARQQFSREGQS